MWLQYGKYTLKNNATVEEVQNVLEVLSTLSEETNEHEIDALCCYLDDLVEWELNEDGTIKLEVPA